MPLIKHSILFIITLSLLFSCNSGRQKKIAAAKSYKTWQTGKLFSDIKVQSDTTLSYALYLPKNYNSKVPNRVMFVFDSHANGLLPVKKYQKLSDKYNVILVASNNSKNGLSAAERNKIISGFLEDVKNRFHIDNNKIFTAGFSGGARIAALIALYNGNVAGVVGCAAGFPQVQNPVNTSFKWVGVVGNKDFNYLELKNLNRRLAANGWKSRLLVFNGKHEWPPVEVMDDAFGLLFGNISGKSKYEANDVPDEMALEKQEIQKQQELVRAMEEKSLSWWNSKINAMQKSIQTASSPEVKLMNRRLINYLSMICYIFTDQALAAGKTELADKYLILYEKTDPENPDVYFFRAKRFAMLNNDKEALLSLQKAVDKGFKDVTRLNDKAFGRLKGDAGFETIKRQLQK
jgi:hypothetical protein